MSYYQVLGLKEAPFSTSPDPDFFYESSAHKEALLRLEIGIKLKRGLSVIFGDVGTGKSTLARKLFSLFLDRTKYEFGMILDPGAPSNLGFLEYVTDAFGVKPDNPTEGGYKKALERYFFQKGVDEAKTVILIVDEAQKLSEHSIESLRTLLNYETNKFKLLQLVLLGQLELLPVIRGIKNFFERISIRYVINPLNEIEIKEMIDFRMKVAGYTNSRMLFNDEAIGLIYDFSQGCPRKICHICHDALEMLIVANKFIVDKPLIQDVINNVYLVEAVHAR